MEKQVKSIIPATLPIRIKKGFSMLKFRQLFRWIPRLKEWRFRDFQSKGGRKMKTLQSTKILCLALVCMLLMATALPALAVSNSETLAKNGDVYYVIASSLNVRKTSTARTSSNIITSLRKGAKVTFLREQNGWWYVKYNNSRYGYVDKQYLTRSNAPKVGNYKVTATSLVIRSFPRSTSPRYSTYGKNTVIKILQLNGDWGRVSYKGREGWVALKYLKKA